MEDIRFSPDFNWDTLKKHRVDNQAAILKSECQRIENLLKEEIKHPKVKDICFTLSKQLNLTSTTTILKELCTRFPGRVWGEDSEGRWQIKLDNIQHSNSYIISVNY